MDVAADSFFGVSAFDKGLEDSCDLVSGSINEGEDLGRFSSLGLASATERSITGSSLDLNFEKSIKPCLLLIARFYLMIHPYLMAYQRSNPQF